MSVENHNICKYCDNAEFDKPCPTCTDLAWEGFSLKEHDKGIRAEAIEGCIKIIKEYANHIDSYADELLEKFEQLKENVNE